MVDIDMMDADAFPAGTKFSWADRLNVYRAQARDLLRCCLCPEPISPGAIIHKIEVDGNIRWSHYACSQRTLAQIVAVRDKRGVSEDRI